MITASASSCKKSSVMDVKVSATADLLPFLPACIASRNFSLNRTWKTLLETRIKIYSKLHTRTNYCWRPPLSRCSACFCCIWEAVGGKKWIKVSFMYSRNVKSIRMFKRKGRAVRHSLWLELYSAPCGFRCRWTGSEFMLAWCEACGFCGTSRLCRDKYDFLLWSGIFLHRPVLSLTNLNLEETPCPRWMSWNKWSDNRKNMIKLKYSDCCLG